MNSKNLEQFNDNCVLSTICFRWDDGMWKSECKLHDKTLNEALTIAKEFGFSEQKWYKPSTWGNSFTVIH